MDGILVLLGLIVKITIMGFATFIVLHILRSMKKRTLRDEISKVEAKMAAFRISLKNRVKKKSKRFRATYPANIATGEPIDISLTQLSELTFEKNTDFQDYIDLCKKINSFIDLANVDKTSDAHQTAANELQKCDFMGTDFKNEISIVRLINDMVMVSKALAKQTNRYNHFDRRAKLQAPEPINFSSLFELQKVYKNKDANDILNEKSDDAKSAA
ncbi:hypothetical protein CIK05_01600 [Bdellovibrio sp. qaytius]|nr:hypothetical protein CIK05_01600 [Bdellovibrio sp. qaytius]